MSITIDRARRIVVPKALRGHFRLHPGTELEIEAEADAPPPTPGPVTERARRGRKANSWQS